MNPSDYKEQRFRHRQGDPKWGGIMLGRSKENMAQSGCLVTCTAYCLSRFYGRDVTPGEWVRWLNAHSGFTGALLIWTKVDEFTAKKLVYTTNQKVKTYVMRNVWVRGVNRQMFSHWVVELSGGLMFDPLDGQIKQIDFYPPVLQQGGKLIQRYLLAKTKPKT